MTTKNKCLGFIAVAAFIVILGLAAWVSHSPVTVSQETDIVGKRPIQEQQSPNQENTTAKKMDSNTVSMSANFSVE